MPAPRGDKWETDIERRLKQLEERASHPLSNTGLSAPGPGVVNVSGQLQGSGFDGDLDVDDVGTTGWALSATKAAMPELLLRPGSIGNDALTNPVVPGVVNEVNTGFGVLAGSWSDAVTFDAVVPADCSRLLVHASGMGFCVNPNTTGGSNGAGGDILELRVTAGSMIGMTNGVSISGSNGQTGITDHVAALLTGLTPGGSVTLKTQVMSGFQGFGTNPTNQANLSAILIWLR